MTTGNLNWRADFRLHTFDLDRQAAAGSAGEPHWMLQNSSLRSMIASLEKDYQKLAAAGGDPFDGGEVTPDAVIAKMGYAGCEEPCTFFATLKFITGFVAACLHQTSQVQAQIGQLRRVARHRARQS